MISKLLVILLCLFVSFGAVCAYSYDSTDSEAQYEAIKQDNQYRDIQYQLDMIQLELEQQRIRDQLDRLLYDDCERDCCW